MGEETTTSPVFTDVLGTPVEMRVQGNGRTILFLHSELGFLASRPVLDGLAGLGRVVAPSHPGFCRTPALAGASTVDDLAYFYLDLIEALNLKDVVVVGASFGAWLAAEIATKSTERLAALVLAGPVGIKVSGREERDIADLYALGKDELDTALFADPARSPKLDALSQEEIEDYCRNREAVTLFAWSPYMHNPKLRARLHRIHTPTLVLGGGRDAFTTPAYHDAYAREIPAARRAIIAGSGHFPHIETPTEFVGEISAFLGTIHARG